MSEPTIVVLQEEESAIFVLARDPDNYIQGPPGPAGPTGPPGDGSAFFLHTQSTASNAWLINHNLNLYPQIQLFTLAWVKIYADEQHLSLNTTQVSFSYPTVGYAVLSL